MPNGNDMLNDLDLDEKIKDWSEPEQFLARNLCSMRKETSLVADKLSSHDKRLTRLERVIIALVSSGALSGGILGMVNWLGG